MFGTPFLSHYYWVLVSNCDTISSLVNLIFSISFCVFVVTGLVCSAILRKLSKKASNVKEQILSIDLEEHSK